MTAGPDLPLLPMVVAVVEEEEEEEEVVVVVAAAAAAAVAGKVLLSTVRAAGAGPLLTVRAAGAALLSMAPAAGVGPSALHSLSRRQFLPGVLPRRRTDRQPAAPRNIGPISILSASTQKLSTSRGICLPLDRPLHSIPSILSPFPNRRSRL
ncbi:hypothetical protein, partial [Ferrimicrobium acidiphilum]|uniref:hypothetical protein n=1 Tax=Ferrimicrobium acidiphilum TaxID=121039 RepID=UPI0023F116B7